MEDERLQRCVILGSSATDAGVGSFEDDIAVEFSICVGGFEDIGDLGLSMSGGSSDICAGSTKGIWGWRLRQGGLRGRVIYMVVSFT